MIDLHPVGHLAVKEKFFSQTSLSKTTWVVSDLKSKLELQTRALKQNPFLENDSVLRARELWRKLFLRQAPEYQILSSDLAHVLLGHWLHSLKLEWVRSSDSQSTLLVYLDQLLPLLVHESGEELLVDWLNDHPQSQIRWRSWYELAKRAWQYLNEMKMIPESMLAAALSATDVESAQWSKDFVFDLGSEISPLEVDLIRRLSEKHHITVLKPETPWTSQFVTSHACYERFK